MAGEHLPGVREQLKILMDQMIECENNLATAPVPLDDKGTPLATYCHGEWDNLICWPNSAPGTVEVPCPEYIVDFNHDEFAKRYCDLNGTWRKSPISPNITWRDHESCLPYGFNKEEIEEKIRNGFVDPHIKSMIQLYTVGYSFSLVALTFAMIILAYFQRLHCTRNYIHMHLFASFMLRAIVIFVKDRVLFIGSGIFDMSTEVSLESLMTNVDIAPGGQAYLVGCKIVMTLFHYFVATNYYWILVEALYLHSLIFVAFFSDKKYLWKFTLIGWGAPVLFVGPWAIVRGTLDNHQCWDISITQYKWIYNGPIVVANVINFLLFLNIIRVLWYKMRERGVINRTDNRRQYRYRKLAKSTLVLIPMFGVHAIIFLGMPDNVTSGVWWDIRMYFDLFFNSFQGFFVAIIYCFCNGEVQAEFKKAWERFNLSVEMQRGNRERSRSSVTVLTSFNSSASNQARLSIAGQGNRRGSNALRNYCQTNNNNLSSMNGVNGFNSTEYRTPLLEESKPETSESCNGVNKDVKELEDYLLSLGPDEHLASYTSVNENNTPQVELPKIHSITEEDFEEKEFELAMEDGETVEKNTTEIQDGSGSSNSSNRNSSSGADSDASKVRRTPSFDSGISSMMGGNQRLSMNLSTSFNESNKKNNFDNSEEVL